MNPTATLSSSSVISHPGELLSAFDATDFRVETLGSYENKRVSRLTATGGFGSGHLDYIEFNPEFIVILPRLRFESQLPVHFADAGWVRMHFRLGGHNTTFFDRARHDMDGAFCNLARLPEGMVSTELHSRRQVGWVTVFCRAEFLRRAFLLDAVRLPAAVEEALGERTSKLVLERRGLPPLAWRLLGEIDLAPDDGALGLVRCEAMVTELICLLMERLVRGDGDSAAVISPAEAEMLHQAREIIRGNLTAPPTIAQLARMLGTNRTTLTRSFRACFGRSIFETIQEERMALATRMLAGGDLTVGQVADALGYGSIASFSHAFKRYFGVPPGASRGLDGTET